MNPQVKKRVGVYHGSMDRGCYYCKSNHSIYTCPDFLKLQVSKRRIEVKTRNLCYNCLKKGHQVSQCSATNCKKCQGKHNTLLHLEAKVTPPDGVVPNPVVASTVTVTGLVGEQNPASYVLLSTARMKVQGGDQRWHNVRALLDSASQSSFITQECAKVLGLKQQRSHVIISGLGRDEINPHGLVELRCRSNQDKSKDFEIQALILSKISTIQPSQELCKREWSHLSQLSLADPLYFKSGKIEVLLGADIYGDLLKGGICRGPEGAPIAIQTTLGWVLLGKTETGQPQNKLSMYHSRISIEEKIQQFWELPEYPLKNFQTEEEMKCESHFQITHSRDTEGRYVVRLPFKSQTNDLGDSRSIAVQRFKATEHRLQANPRLYEQYRAFIQEYSQLGHMKPITAEEKKLASNQVYYLPHHAVFNPSSSSTKVRVVFDASSKSSSGISLNDILMVGPKLQLDIIPLLLKFRMHSVALLADIKKMYRQIRINEADTNYLWIVWRDKPEEELRDFKLVTVTYGTASAPYQATKCLQQLAIDEEDKYPVAAKILKTDFYVDDLLSGAESVKEAIFLQADLVKLLASGGFELCKWVTNSVEVQATIPQSLQQSSEPVLIGDKSVVKALGLYWNPTTDTLAIGVKPFLLQETPTKRNLLAHISMVYDPLGFLAPITIQAKLFFQSLWKQQLSWDQPLTEAQIREWNQYQQELSKCREITIPRKIIIPGKNDLQIHAFCDASEQAYAAVIYLQAKNAQTTAPMSLTMAKTRVAPLKSQTLPRLELCAAVLLAKCIKVVMQTLLIPGTQVFAYSDSMIVLAWLAASPSRWTQFVANRVSEVQQLLPHVQWRHIDSAHNPADCASRGISYKDFSRHPLWWNGPMVDLKKNDSQDQMMGQPSAHDYVQIDQEKKRTVIKQYQTQVKIVAIKWSSLSQLQRVTAWCRRFINNSRCQNTGKKKGPLDAEELQQGLLVWVKLVQQSEFHQEISQLLGSGLSHKSPFLALNPFLDAEGFIRVGGRISRSQIAESRKHPLLLPKDHQLTQLIVNHEHSRLLHGGAQITQAAIQQRFWIPHLRSLVRRMIHKCVTCQRHNAKGIHQLMGDLPLGRVTPSRPFTHCGVDCAGPFIMRTTNGRRQIMGKVYICLFICFPTKAIHVEVLTSLSAQAFLACLRRFTARRGYAAHLYSDCGKNFMGTDAILRKWMHDWKNILSDEALSNFLSMHQMKWHFNPPATPHFGGIWEAGIKAFKRHFTRVMGTTALTLEEFITVSTQIEACLNSRPLSQLSMSPDDLSVLTPAHFLIGESLIALPDPDQPEVTISHITRWELCQRLVQHFWKRWHMEYLTQLQQRCKWRKVQENITVGQLVLIKDSNQGPLQWKRGRVLEVHPGKDGLVRSVTLKTAVGILVRPIVKLVVLPVQDDT